MSFVKYVLSLVFIMAIAACGGGGGSAGTSSGSAVVVAPLITTAPAALTVAVGAVQDYRISGGKAPYQVSSSNVQVSVASVSDTNLKITGIATGSSNVVVTDSAGVTTAVAVTVGNLSELFSNAPSTVNLSPSTNASFTVGGGVPGYSVSTTDARIASASLSGTTIFINAIAVGNATITVRDASGKTKDIPVVVGSLIALYTTAPSSFTIAKDSQRNFTVSGGVPGYSVESVDTRIVVATLTGASLNIRGVAVGSANVLIRDTVNSQLLTLNVTVGGDSPLGLFTSAPGSLIVVKDSQTTYSVGGGVAGYSVESSDRRIATASVSGSSIVINAIALGATTITIRDAAGTSLNIALTVGSSNPGAFFTSAPSALSLSTGTSLSYSISGGAQPYSVVSSDARVVVGNISGATVIITALKAGTAALQIADATGKTLPIVVTADGTSAGAGGPAGIEVLSSSSSLTSAVGSKVTFVVTAKDAVNTGIPNQIVTFTASSGTLTGANPSPSTDVNGSITTISLSPGADLSNRTITVTATAGSVSKSINIPVVGTSVSISGAGSALVGNPALTYSVKAVDSGGKPIVGANLVLSSTTGNTISPQSVTTDLAGAANFSFTPTVAGTDTLKVAGLGTSAAATVAVSNEDFAFIVPSAANLVVNSANTVTVRYKVGGVGVAGKSVTFSTTRGSLSSSTMVTNSSGDASTTVNSTTAGPVTVSAQLGTARSSITSAFVATIPASVVIQANPGAVLPNAAGSTSNQSTLSATVRDATGNPVAGQVVNFTAIQDGSNGTIVPGSGTTDSNGMTSVQFIPGALSTAANGVKLQATVQSNQALSATASLTVSGEALFITIGIANKLTVLDTVTYEKDFSVYVTDANGAPAVNRAVTMSVYPKSYGRGNLCSDKNAPARWVYNSLNLPVFMVNEDTNRNGILDAGEDSNADGRLNPGIPVVITPSNLTTDSAGYAAFKLRYGKNYAYWIDTEITARALVGGTESSKLASYFLEMTADDALVANSSAANLISPFGADNTTCPP